MSWVILQRRLERRSQGDGRAGIAPVSEFVLLPKPEVEFIVIHLSRVRLPLNCERLDGLVRKTYSEAVPALRWAIPFHG